MASRNQRRRRARERAATHRGATSRVTAAALSSVTKAAESRQVNKPNDDGFLEMYDSDRAIRPPIPPDKLWNLYEENAIHSAAIDAKVADSVGRGWKLDVEDEGEEGAGEDERATMRAVRDWLREVCAPSGMSFNQLVSQLVREYDAIGWGAWEISRDGDTIDGIFPIPAHTLRAVKNDPDVYVQVKGEEKVFFSRFGSDKKVSVKDGRELSGDGDEAANEVLVLKHYSPRTPFYGIPRWVSGIPGVAEFASIREYNIQWHESGGTGDRLVHVKAKDAEVAKNLADSITQQIKNSKGVGHTTIVSHGSEDTEVQDHQLSSQEGKRDGQFKERRAELVTEILMAHQVPPYRVGWAVLGGLGGSAAGEMIDAYRFGVVEPIQDAVHELLNASLFNVENGGFDLRGYTFCFIDPDWSEMEPKVEKATAAVQFGMATPAEGAEILGLEVPPEDERPELYRYYYQGQPIGANQAGVDAAEVVRQMKSALEAVVKGEADMHEFAESDDPDVCVVCGMGPRHRNHY